MTRLTLIPLGAALALGGCSPAASDPAPVDATMGEAKALGEAAEMVEHRRPPSADETPSQPEDTGSKGE